MDSIKKEYYGIVPRPRDRLLCDTWNSTDIWYSMQRSGGKTGAGTVLRLLCSCLLLSFPRRHLCQHHVAGHHTKVARLGAAPAMHERWVHTWKIPPTRAVTDIAIRMLGGIIRQLPTHCRKQVRRRRRSAKLIRRFFEILIVEME